MKELLALLMVSPILALSACSNVDSGVKRAALGAAIGCAAGEVLIEDRCVEGAVVGAGVGVLTE